MSSTQGKKKKKKTSEPCPGCHGWGTVRAAGGRAACDSCAGGIAAMLAAPALCRQCRGLGTSNEGTCGCPSGAAHTATIEAASRVGDLVRDIILNFEDAGLVKANSPASVIGDSARRLAIELSKIWRVNAVTPR